MAERKSTPALLGETAGHLANLVFIAYFFQKWGWSLVIGYAIWQVMWLVVALSIRAWKFQ